MSRVGIMLIRFFDKLAGFDSVEIDRFFRESPDAAMQYSSLMNDRNVHNAVVFLYFIIFSQIIVAYGRIVGNLGFPYYNTFLSGLALTLILVSRYAFFKTNIRRISLFLFTAWAATFPFFIIRLGGYDSPTYPIYILVIIYIIAFFYFSFWEYVYVFALIFASNVAIVFLQQNVNADDFLYRQVVMLMATVVGLAASYINVNLRRKDFFNQFSIEKKKNELEAAYKQLENTELQLIQSEKLASLGKMTAGIAHEINNPLGFIQGNLENIEGYLKDLKELVRLYDAYPKTNDDVTNRIQAFKQEIQYDFIVDDLSKIIQSCERGTSRIAEIVNKLRNFSRLDESAKKLVDIHEGLDATIDLFTRQNQHIIVNRNYSKIPQIECYASQLNQVFFSLIENAMDAVAQKSDGGQITVITGVADDGNEGHDAENNRMIRIQISDNGCGIPENIQSKIFDPFFTSKDVGEGRGLGLSLAYGIVQKHRGRIYFDSDPGRGTDFFVELPPA
ncbi:HAMP domain-containing histidine kinase [bacterium]|nr:HAMP domain-containing histidine kinase [bacterium]